MDGRPVAHPQVLLEAIKAKQQGDSLDLVVMRGAERMEAEAMLTARAGEFETFSIPLIYSYEAKGEHAVITHDTFDSTAELKFHLTKGAANRYKKEIDKIAVPENYYFRGPVEWMIRTYSKFMHLPATYSTLGSHFTAPGGSMSSGLTS